MQTWPNPFPASFSQMRTLDTTSPYGCAPGELTNASVAWPTTNKIIYQPFVVPVPITVRQFYVYNGATASGNLDVGIYTRDGRLLVSKGSTAQSGVFVSALQLLDITDTLLAPGTYYLAVTADNTTATFTRISNSTLPLVRLVGVLSETPGSFGLPALATFVAAADAYIPLAGLSMASAI